MQGKGKKDCNVVLSEKFLQLLGNYIKKYKQKDYLIEGLNSGRYSDKNVQSVMK